MTHEFKTEVLFLNKFSLKLEPSHRKVESAWSGPRNSCIRQQDNALAVHWKMPTVFVSIFSAKQTASGPLETYQTGELADHVCSIDLWVSSPDSETKSSWKHDTKDCFELLSTANCSRFALDRTW